MAKKREENGNIDLPVSFGGFSNGDKTCRIGISFDRSAMSLAQVDKHFSGKRLTGTLYAVAKGDAPGQATLPGTEGDVSVSGAFDVKGFGCDDKHFSVGLTFSNAEDDLTMNLCHMAKRSGRLVIEAVEKLEDAEESGESDVE